MQTTAMRKLCCVNCGIEIASKSDVYTVPGAEGTTGAYVNPQGYVHQTVTLRTASNIMVSSTTLTPNQRPRTPNPAPNPTQRPLQPSAHSNPIQPSPT